jgi:site-specific recombinase XerD
MTPITLHIEEFLCNYLVLQRGLSKHTIDSYAYSFLLLFEFAANKNRLAPTALMVEHLDPTLIASFLEDLEKTRHNSADTRNIRLAAIRSFFRFLEYRLPARLEQIRRILAIPFKKTDTRLVPYLNQEEIQALLDAPDPTTRMGIRDRAMLHVAICAGLRVSELVGLQKSDIGSSQNSILVHGKGRRERTLPLWKVTTTTLQAWLDIRGSAATPGVFINAQGQSMTRWGFAYVLKRHVNIAVAGCPSLAKKRVSPHVLRHACAMMVLQATHDIRKVSLWLGHSNLETTEMYTRADPSEKLEAIEAMVPPHLRKGVFRPPDKLLAMLRTAK